MTKSPRWGMAFNRMTSQLAAQRGDLVAANRQIDERRRFTETVLSGVSAGVIGLDSDGNITIVNRAAARLLNATPEELEGRHYAEAVPELAGLIRRALSEPAGRAGGEVTVKRSRQSASTVSVQVSSEAGMPRASSSPSTTSPIWCRRNAPPPGPMWRGASPMRSRIRSPPSSFRPSGSNANMAAKSRPIPRFSDQCTDTIIRQVGDIGRMVDEFSSFARMPTPVMQRENAQELLQQAVFLQRVAHPDIAFQVEAPEEPVHFEGDGRLISPGADQCAEECGRGHRGAIGRRRRGRPGRSRWR